jgi:hypothetical protein
LGLRSIRCASSVRATVPVLTSTPWKRRKKSRTFFRPKLGKRVFVRTISSCTREGSFEKPREPRGLPRAFVSKPFGPSRR